jgi:hypothetical protein
MMDLVGLVVLVVLDVPLKPNLKSTQIVHLQLMSYYVKMPRRISGPQTALLVAKMELKGRNPTEPFAFGDHRSFHFVGTLT